MIFFRSGCLCVQFCCSFFSANPQQLSCFEIKCCCGEGDLESIFKARVLSYSTTTWMNYASPLRQFVEFIIQENSKFSNVGILKYLMYMINNDATVDKINNFFNALKFIISFLDLKIVISKPVFDIKRFALKVCGIAKISRKVFASTEISELWNRFFEKFNDMTKAQIRTFVLIVTLHSTFCRFDCISNVKLHHIVFHEDYIKIIIPFSKTDVNGHGDCVYIPNNGNSRNPHKLLCLYLNVMDFEDENFFLFPSLEWNSTKKCWLPKRLCLSYSAAYKSFKKLLTELKIDNTHFSLHSMRIGAATDAYKNGVPLDVIDKQGRWKCSQSKFIYIKRSEEEQLKHLKIAANY